eukprot:3926242-Prorocentrum_lima.AAC.1
MREKLLRHPAGHRADLPAGAGVPLPPRPGDCSGCRPGCLRLSLVARAAGAAPLWPGEALPA